MDNNSFSDSIIGYILANNLYMDVALYIGIILGALIGYLLAVHFSPSYLHWREKCAKNKQERTDARKIKRELKQRLILFKAFILQNEYKLNKFGFYSANIRGEDISLCKKCSDQGIVSKLVEVPNKNEELIFSCTTCFAYYNVSTIISLIKN